jgi:hypothetical protein
MDATAARVLFGAGGLVGSAAEASIALYRDVHHDLWHWMDIHAGPSGIGGCNAPLAGAFLAGQAFVNSHYQRQLQGWAAFLAMTGQSLDAAAGSLHFAPTCEGRERSADGGFELRLPFVSPVALGLVRVRWHASSGAASAALELLRGALPARVAGAATLDLSRCPDGGGRAVGALRLEVVDAGAAA